MLPKLSLKIGCPLLPPNSSLASHHLHQHCNMWCIYYSRSSKTLLAQQSHIMLRKSTHKIPNQSWIPNIYSCYYFSSTPSFGNSSHPLNAYFCGSPTALLGHRAPRAAKMSQKCRALRQRRLTVRRTNLPQRTANSNTGWWFQHLWKILVSWDGYSQYMRK